MSPIATTRGTPGRASSLADPLAPEGVLDGAIAPGGRLALDGGAPGEALALGEALAPRGPLALEGPLALGGALAFGGAFAFDGGFAARCVLGAASVGARLQAASASVRAIHERFMRRECTSEQVGDDAV